MRQSIFVLMLMLVMGCAAGAGAQIPISGLPPAAVPLSGAEIIPIVQSGRTVQTPVSAVALLAASASTSLTQFYAPGTHPCSSAAADQAAFAAAYAYMVSKGGAYISIPAGLCYHSTGLLIANKSGWIAPPGAVMITETRVTGSAADTSMVALDNPYDTGWVFYGPILNGGYDGSQTNWLDHQHGLNLTNAFNGISDPTYTANSAIGYQGPKGFVARVQLANFGGDCAQIVGAGANNFQFDAFNCGGRGAYINQYDSKFELDIGSTGRSGVYLDANGSVDQFTNTKIWFNGSRGVSGDKYGLTINLGSQNDFAGLIVQDQYFDAIHVSGNSNTIRGLVQWANVANGSVGANTSAITTVGGTQNRFEVNVQFYAPYSNVTYLVNDASSTSTYSVFDLTEQGMQSDIGIWNAAWFHGALADSNKVSLNNIYRAPRQWVPLPSNGQIPFTDLSGCGMDVDDTYNSTTITGCAGGLHLKGLNSGVYSADAIAVDLNGALTIRAGGTLAAPTAAAITAIGTSGATIPLLNTANTWGATQTFGAITSSSLGTAAAQNTGTSGATVPLLNGANTWSSSQAFSVATKAPGEVATGAAPTASGTCTISGLFGGNTAGGFSSGTCAGTTIKLSFSTTAPNGWACFASNLTSPARTVTLQTYDASSATFVANTTSGDAIAYGCKGF